MVFVACFVGGEIALSVTCHLAAHTAATAANGKSKEQRERGNRVTQGETDGAGAGVGMEGEVGWQRQHKAEPSCIK